MGRSCQAAPHELGEVGADGVRAGHGERGGRVTVRRGVGGRRPRRAGAWQNAASIASPAPVTSTTRRHLRRARGWSPVGAAQQRAGRSPRRTHTTLDAAVVEVARRTRRARRSSSAGRRRSRRWAAGPGAQQSGGEPAGLGDADRVEHDPAPAAARVEPRRWSSPDEVAVEDHECGRGSGRGRATPGRARRWPPCRRRRRPARRPASSTATYGPVGCPPRRTRRHVAPRPPRSPPAASRRRVGADRGDEARLGVPSRARFSATLRPTPPGVGRPCPGLLVPVTSGPVLRLDVDVRAADDHRDRPIGAVGAVRARERHHVVTLGGRGGFAHGP